MISYFILVFVISFFPFFIMFVNMLISIFFYFLVFFLFIFFKFYFFLFYFLSFSKHLKGISIFSSLDKVTILLITLLRLEIIGL